MRKRLGGRCSSCGEVVPVDGYYPYNPYRCKGCIRRYSRERARGHEALNAEPAAYSLCVRCGERKPGGDFYRSRYSKNGLAGWCKPCRKTYGTERARRARAKVIEAYGGLCVCCGYDYADALAFDHVNGDGAADRKVRGSCTNIISYLHTRLPEIDPTLQLLCHNCNFLKGTGPSCPCGGYRTSGLCSVSGCGNNAVVTHGDLLFCAVHK